MAIVRPDLKSSRTNKFLLTRHGFTGGVEVDIHGLSNPDSDFPRLREICDQAGLEISTMSVHTRNIECLEPEPPRSLMQKTGYTHPGSNTSVPVPPV